MKRIALSFITASLAAVSLAPVAEAMPMNRPMESQDGYGVDSQDSYDMEYREEYGLDAFDLTYFAYQGNLENQGIPGYLELITSINAGQVEAEDLIEAAVDAGRLSTSAMDDETFEQEVETILESLPSRVE